MTIPIEIEGSSKGNGVSRVEVYNPSIDNREGEAGLTVYVRERDLHKNSLLPFLNADFGAAMNQDGEFGGTPIGIHNGTDSVLWTGTNVIGGKVTFDSTDAGRPSGGTKSVRVDNPASGDVWQFDKGSSQDLSGYVALTLNINIDKDWTEGDSVSIYGWDTTGSTQVGNKVLLENYVNTFDFDVAQVAAIPLADLGLTEQTVYAFRMQQESTEGKAAKFYIDDFQIEETGEPVEYRVTTNVQKTYLVDRLVLTIADVLSGTLTDGAGMTPLSYNKILDENSLASGIGLRKVVDGETDFSIVFSNIGDFLTLGFKITNQMSDGTNVLITLEQEFDNPLRIKGPSDLNFIEFTINDNLTGLSKFNAILRGREVANQ